MLEMDLVSRNLTPAIFESLRTWPNLWRPQKICQLHKGSEYIYP